MDSDAEIGRGAQAVHRVLRVLLCWTSGEPTRSLTEIANDTGLTLPTAHRMVKALQSEGFLAHDSASGRYGVGPTVMDLARVVLQRADEDELVLVALPHMERIRAITGETVGIHVPMSDSRICVAELVSRQQTRAASGVGRSFKLPGGAAGRVLTAWSSERREMVRAGKDTSSAAARLRRDVLESSAKVREDGYAITFNEAIPGAAAVAIPVFDSNGDVRASIGVMGPVDRWTKAKMLEFLPAVIDEVTEIEAQLGYRRRPEKVIAPSRRRRLS
jgi:IclR family KDG regulon transcriptional repressor